MVESGESDQPSERQPNWVEKCTFYFTVVNCAVFAATMVGVFIYACEARIANDLTRQVLESTTRPYVGAFLHTDYFGTKNADLTYASKAPLRMGFDFYDYGKTPTDAHVRSVVTYSVERKRQAEPFPNEWHHFRVWPQQTNGLSLQQRDFAYGITNITDADIVSIRQGKGFVYVAIEIRYSKYHTLICKEYSLREARDIRAPGVVAPNARGIIPLPMPRLCDDPNSNCTDEDCK